MIFSLMGELLEKKANRTSDGSLSDKRKFDLDDGKMRINDSLKIRFLFRCVLTAL